MAQHPCSSCGRLISPSLPCPHCGAEGSLEEELERIERSIAEMSRRDMAIVKERSQLASKMQAALFQRDILAHANRERLKQSARGRRVRRRRPRAADDDFGPPFATTDGATTLVDDPPPVEPTVAPPPPPYEPEPEASSRSVQNILLGLGALLLAVAAVVFAGVAISALQAVGRAVILAACTTLALSVAAPLARRGLTSTAETVAAVGLALVPMAGYALHGLEALGGESVSAQVFLGWTFAVTAAVSFGYAGAVRLAAPRYATVLAAQPVVPLIGSAWIDGPAGWALAYTVVGILDLALLSTVIKRGRLVPRWPEGRPQRVDRPDVTEAEADDPDVAVRPETAPEEPDLIIEALAPPARRRWRPLRIFSGPRPSGAPVAGTRPTAPPSAPPSVRWLRELTMVLIAGAVGVALLYGTGALLGADLGAAAVRAAVVLVLAGLTAVVAARLVRDPRAENIAGALLTLIVVGSAARVAAVAAPGRTVLVTSVVVALTGLVVRMLPDDVRRGPQLASAAALATIGTVVAVDVLRAAVAPVAAARPVWQADTTAYAARIAEAVGPGGWQLALSALLLTFAAALALPREIRHESAIAGVALTALAVPASLRLPWSEAPWPLVVGAVGLGATGLAARTRRVAVTHVVAAGIVGLFGAGAALAAPWLTAAVLTALTGAGIMVAMLARQLPARLYAWLVGDWAAGAAAFALPGAVAAAGVAVTGPDLLPPPTEATTVPIMAATFLAVAATLAYAAVTQVARREISTPLTIGTGLGALAVTIAAFRAPGAAPPDRWVGALLLVAAVLLLFAPSIDANRRADRIYDGPDVAAAAATVGIIGALSRVAGLLYPSAELVATAAVLLAVALAIRAMPTDWRRGPVFGVTLSGTVVLLIAGYFAVREALRALSLPGSLWAADLNAWPTDPPAGAWQAPITLALLAVAAAAALPRPASYDVAAGCAGLAAVSAPTAFGLPWWSPLLVGGAVVFGYAAAAVSANDPRAALARASVAAAVGLHTVGASLARPWTTAAALIVVVVVGTMVAGLARAEGANWPVAPTTAVGDEVVDLALDDTGMPRHLAQIGGAATAGTLIALPGIFAAAAAALHESAQVVLTAALAASSISLAVLAVFGRFIPQYLPSATVGIVGGATITALVSLPTEHPTALYAAAAALLGVVAELLRGATAAPGVTVAPPRRWTGGQAHDPTRWTALRPLGLRGRWSVDPATGAVVVAALPTALAVASLAPALVAALVDPFQQLGAIWAGPVAALTDPVADALVDGTSVLAAVLLTVAAALAALGFGGRAAESVPVILPGLAVTLLIAPIALNAAWPGATMAALTVFTVAMLGLALTPPPVATRAPLLRATRHIVFGIGLAAGGAGLAGSLATRQLTLFTLGSAVGVGLIAAMAGRTAAARILGWLFAALMGQLFALTAGLVAGLEPEWSSFGVLAVGAALLVLEAALPRLGRPEHLREATTVEWSGYAAALLALALAYSSLPHLAALLAAWGAVLGLAATRPGRRPNQRRGLFWAAVALEIVAWWLLMTLSDVALPEAYTLPFAALALVVGLIESRQRPDLSSWAAYGPALLAAFVPTVGVVLTTDTSDLRELLLLLGAVATLIIGSRLQQQAPVVVGAVVTAVAALHFTVTLVGPWLVLVPVGVVLLALGASDENRRRTQERFRGLTRMR